ncbi:MAG: cobalamin-independent methionine synthase II family protein [Actinobacteria bacterium]|nr:cobalamin-independent methionine synthase II family protein [Actinomycetota bacterium]
MKHSDDRILTTHTGSLPRPPKLTELVYARQEGKAVDEAEFHAEARKATIEVVRKQRERGVDIVSDGEMNKPGFVNYVGERLTGFGGLGAPWTLEDMKDMPDLVSHLYGGPGGTHIKMPRCEGEIAYEGEALVAEDIDNLKEAIKDDDSIEAFIPAASPGCISMAAENLHYPDYESYLGALSDAMKVEYKAIVDAGFLVQLDCPDIPMTAHTASWATPYVEEIGYDRYLALHIDALDAAVADLPADRVRMHLCWGNYGGPHTQDIDLQDVLEPVLKAKPMAISFEGANPRHEHEWQTLAAMDIPDDKILMPGVIDTKSNVVEHPMLVAQRIERYAEILGRDRIIPGTDCGFGTFVGFGIEPDVAWLKLAALGEGAALASEALWSASRKAS